MKTLDIDVLKAIAVLVTHGEYGVDPKFSFGYDYQHGDCITFKAERKLSIDSHAIVNIYSGRKNSSQYEIKIYHGQEDSSIFENMQGLYSRSEFIEKIDEWLKQHPYISEVHSQDE